MISEKCVNISEQEALQITETWHATAPDESIYAVLSSLGLYGKGSWEGETKSMVAAQFKALIESYCVVNNEVVMPKTTAEMEQVLAEARKDKAEQDKKLGKAGSRLIVVGGMSMDMEEVTGVLGKPVSINQDVQTDNRKALADVVEKQMMKAAKRAGLIRNEADWNSGEIASSKELKPYKDVVKLISKGALNGNLGNVFCAITMACSVYTEKNKDGSIKKTGLYYDVKDIRKALEGDRLLMDKIWQDYSDMGKGKRPSAFEQSVMDALLAIYADNNADFVKKLRSKNINGFRAANGSSRIQKTLAESLRGLRELVTDNSPIEIKSFKVPVKASLTTDLVMQIIGIARPAMMHLGVDFIEQMTTNMLSWIDNNDVTIYGVITMLSDAIEYNNPNAKYADNWTSNNATDETGEYVNGLKRDQVHDILELLYRNAFENAIDANAVDVMNTLASAGRRKVKVTGNFSYNRELQEVFDSMQASVRARSADNVHPDIMDGGETISPENQMLLDMTSARCSAVYDTPTLRTRVNAIATRILFNCERTRGKALKANKEQLDAVKGELQEKVTRKKELDKKSNLTEDEEKEKKQLSKDIVNKLREQATLRKSRTRLLNRRTLYSEALRLSLAEHVDYAKDQLAHGAEAKAGEEAKRKQDVDTALALWDDLLPRAFAQIEAATGVSIIYNRDSNAYKVQEEKNEPANGEQDSEDGNNNEDSESRENDDSMDFREDVDPYAHLTQNVRAGFALLPILDPVTNEPVLDDLGLPQYYDPKSLYFATMSMHEGLVTEPDDFCEMKTTDLDDTEKRNPSMFNQRGMSFKNRRTDAEAFPHGKPTFTVLEENIGRHPWVKQLIDRLTEDYMEMYEDEEDRNEMSYGQLATDLYDQMGYIFTKRAVYRSNMKNAPNPFHIVNTIAEVESVRRAQQRNYNQRIPLSKESMIWYEDGKINMTTCDNLAKNLAQLMPAESMTAKSVEEKQAWIDTLHDALTRMGFEIDKQLLMNEFSRPNVEGLGRLNRIEDRASTVLRYLSSNNPNASKLGVYGERTIFSNLTGVWRNLYDAVGFFVDTSEVQSTQNINGKAQQNFVAESAFSKNMTILTYGWKQMKNATPEKREELLKKRQEKIRKLYGDTFQARYDGNRIIRQLYNGEDVDFMGADDVPQQIQRIGETVLINMKDDIEFAQLSPEDQAEMQMAAFLRNEQVARGGSALYRFPVPADSPVMTFTSGTAMDKQECIADLATKSLAEAARIAHNNEEVRPNYVRTWAIERGRVNWNAGTYYDVLDKREREIPGAEKWMWERDRAIHAFITAKDNAERSLAYQDILNLAEASKNNPNSVGAWDADEAIEMYRAWRRWYPRESFFGSECRFRTIPNLETTVLAVQDVLEQVAQRAHGTKLEADVRNKIDEIGRAMSRQDGWNMRMYSILHNVIDVLGTGLSFEESLSLAADQEFNKHRAEATTENVNKFIISQIAQLYTQAAMDEQYRDYRAKLTVEDYELLQLHRISSMFANNDPDNNPGVDAEGNSWRLVQSPDSESGFGIMNTESGTIFRLNTQQFSFYQNLISERRGGFGKNGKVAFAVGKSGNSYQRDQIERYKLPLKNQDALEKIVKDAANSPTLTNPMNMTLADRTEAYLELMFLNTYRHNTEMLDAMMVDSAMFPDGFDETKRLKGLMANGTRLNPNRITADNVEYAIITADDKNSISHDYVGKTKALIKAVAQGRVTAEDAMATMRAYRHQNATDAQGYISPQGYRRKASAAGSANFDVESENLYQDMQNGTRHLGEDYDGKVAFNALKQVGYSYAPDIDPTGRVVMVPQYVKNSEGMLMQTNPNMKSPKSARLMALQRFMEETEAQPLRTKDGKPVVISTSQKPSGVKTPKKGVVDTRYLPSRVRFLQKLAMGQEVPTTVDGVDVSEMLEEWRLFLQAMAENQGIDLKNEDSVKSLLSFDVIDGFIHNGDAKVKGTNYKGLARLTEEALNGVNSDNAVKQIERLIAMRDFMLPIQATSRVVKEMQDVIRGAVVEEGGIANDQFVYGYNTEYQHIQVRQSNHLVDSEAHLGSQISYIAAEAINFDEDYEVLMNGVKFNEKVKGRVLYNKLYECLAARLVHGLNEYNKILTGEDNAVNLHNLQEYLLKLTMNNPKFKTSDIWYALQIVKNDDTGEERFATPLASVAIIYKISDVLTSIVRNHSHRKGMEGSGNAVIEADELYENQLGVRRDDNGKIIGVECFLPAWMKDIVQHCLKEVTEEITVNGETVTVTHQELDFEKLKGTGLETIVGYRIPTEDAHSCLPLIVKGFLPQEKGNTIVVSKDVVTMSGSDNDIDKLFLMLRHIDKQLLKNEGKLQPVQYHWNPNQTGGVPDVTAVSQSDEQIENMIIDIMHSILTHPGNEARLMSPQNPNIFDDVSVEIAYINLPAAKHLRYRRPEYTREGRIKHGTGEWVYNPDDPDWNNKDVYQREYLTGQLPDFRAMKRHLEAIQVMPVQSPDAMAYYHAQHTMAKTGIGIMANRMATHFKIRTALKVLNREGIPIEMKGDANGKVVIDGKTVMYCPGTNMDGESTTSLVANTGGSVVDSGKSPALTNMGITLDNLSFMGFLESCGLGKRQIGYICAIMKKYPNLRDGYYKAKGSLYGEGKKHKDSKANLSAFTTADLQFALRLDNLTSPDAWERFTSHNLANVCHGIVHLINVYNKVKKYEAELNANSAKQGMSNDPSSAVWAKQQIDLIYEMVTDDKFPLVIPQEMILRNGLSEEEIANGEINLANGDKMKMAMWLPQMYHTLGVEKGLEAMSDLMLHARPEFEQIVRIFAPVWRRMSKDDAIKFIRRLHDHFSTFFISSMNLFDSETDADGNVIRGNFVEMRNYYCYRFPAEFASMSSKRRAELNAKYPFLAVLEFTEGRLILNDELKEGFNAEDIRQSLNNMAASTDPAEKALAEKLFKYAYFTDGLRFGYGALSNAFTAGFLASDMFQEYNERINKITTEPLPTDFVGKFCLQFIANNAKDCQIGVLFRATKGYERDGEGGVIEIAEDKADPAKDELTPKEIARLEHWLESRESGGRLYLDQKEQLTRPGKEPVELPKELLRRITAYYGDKPEGNFFRVQSSYSIYAQNTYFINKDSSTGRVYIMKIKDFTNTVWYNANMDITQMAYYDTVRTIAGKRGAWDRVLIGRMREQDEEREKFLNNEPNPWLMNYKPKKDGNLTDSEFFAQNDFDDWGAPEFGNTNDPWAEDDPEDWDEFSAPNLGNLPSVEKNQELRVEKREGDKTSVISVTDVKEELFPNSDQPSGIMFMIPVRNNTENVEERKAELLRNNGADGQFTSWDEAVAKAQELNDGQNEFVAVIEGTANDYKITLYNSTDIQAAEVWRSQRGSTIITGPTGINEVMNGFGDPSVNFVKHDDAVGLNELTKLIDDVVALLRAIEMKATLPAMTPLAARAIVAKFMKNDARLMDEVKNIVEQARNGEANAKDFVESMTSIATDSLTDAEVENVAVDLLSAMMENAEEASSKLKQKSMTYFKNQFQAGINRMRNSLGANRNSTPDFTEQRNKLLQIKQRAITASGGHVPNAIEQRQAEQEHMRMTNQFNALDRLYKIMRKALVMEQRKERILIQDGYSADKTRKRINMLRRYLNNNGTVDPAGVVNYLMQLTNEYKDLEQFFNELNSGAGDYRGTQKLERLAQCLNVVRSHEEILDNLRELMSDDSFVQKLIQFNLADSNVATTMKEMFDRVDTVNQQIKTQLKKHAGNAFMDFVREFVGDVPLITNRDGSVMTWTELMNAVDSDISLIDQYLRSMGNTNDPVGQIFDLVVKKQKDKAREMAIKDQQGKIKRLAQMMTSMKLTNFEFLFEHDENGKKTGYYLSQIKWGQFHKEFKPVEDALNKVLRSETATEAEKATAQAEFDRWCTQNDVTRNTAGIYTPKSTSRWLNPEYTRLQDSHPDEFRFYNEFMSIKKEFDERLGQFTNHERAIQRRMTSEQRFRANFTLDPNALWENVKQALASEYLVREDDYEEYGERSAVLDYEGNERTVIPAPFVRMLKNPDELSTDPIGCLIAYSYTTANFEMMKEIANPMEVGFNALVNDKVQYDVRSGRTVTETFRTGEKQKAVVRQSRLLKKIRDFMDSQLYMKYIDDGRDTFKIFGLEFRKSKVINAFLHMSAVAQLGFNWLVDLANLANGILQTNIEAFGRKHFSGAQLLKADNIYRKELVKFLPDLGRPIKESKLALIDEKFNIMQNFDVKIYNNRRYDLLSKLFNTSFAFMGTAGGNHWLYNRTAIAMMLNTEVIIKNGDTETKTNLWDALDVVDNDEGGKQVVLKDGATVDGKAIDNEWLAEFGRKIADVNHGIVGIYNKDDMMMASRISWLRLFIAFRKHLVPLMDKRYRGKHKNELTGEEVQGYMRTFGEYLRGLHNAQYNVPAAWNELSEEEKQDVRMALTDCVQFLGLLMLCLLPFGGDDDDDEDGKLAKICKYLLARERHEMGSMLPTVYMPKEIVNMAEQPTIGTPQIADITNFATTVFTPWTWDDQVQSGPFAGMSNFEMRLRKLPVPPLTYYRNIDKSLNGVNSSTWFYNRGYVGGGGSKA